MSKRWQTYHISNDCETCTTTLTIETSDGVKELRDMTPAKVLELIAGLANMASHPAEKRAKCSD